MTDEGGVRVEQTPNPNALKFTVNRMLAEGRAQNYTSPEQAFASPLARSLLAVPGVKSVFLLRDFASITRVDGAAWEPIIEQVHAVLTAEREQQ